MEVAQEAVAQCGKEGEQRQRKAIGYLAHVNAECYSLNKTSLMLKIPLHI